MSVTAIGVTSIFLKIKTTTVHEAMCECDMSVSYIAMLRS